MFKFIKSKKGFTLVELMIVVVIMAILVAVAVPIFSVVTNNARTKTCIGNQREIISALGNWLMLQPSYEIEGVFTTWGGSDNPQWCEDEEFTDDLNAKAEDIKGLFKTIPACPDSNSRIKVTVIKGTSENTRATVETECVGAYSAEHKVPGLE